MGDINFCQHVAISPLPYLPSLRASKGTSDINLATHTILSLQQVSLFLPVSYPAEKLECKRERGPTINCVAGKEQKRLPNVPPLLSLD